MYWLCVLAIQQLATKQTPAKMKHAFVASIKAIIGQTTLTRHSGITVLLTKLNILKPKRSTDCADYWIFHGRSLR